MGDLTPNFNLAEFSSRGTMPWDRPAVERLAWNLEVVREQFNRAAAIVSGCRTQEHNDEVGGAKKSRHLTCTAADFWIEGVSPQVLHATVLELIRSGRMDPGGVGLYRGNTPAGGWVHYDTRGELVTGFGNNEESSLDTPVSLLPGLSVFAVYGEDKRLTPPETTVEAPEAQAVSFASPKTKPDINTITAIVGVAFAIATVAAIWWYSRKGEGNA